MRSSWWWTLIVRPAICRMEHVKTVREKLRTVIRQAPLKVMMKLPAKPPASHLNRTVKMPRRWPNAELRSREHLTDAEIERLMATAWNNRGGHRDATMILAYHHGLSEVWGRAPRPAWSRASTLNSTAAPIPLRPPCELAAPAFSKSSSPRCVPTPRRRSFDWGFSSGPAQTPRRRTPGCRSPVDCGV